MIYSVVLSYCFVIGRVLDPGLIILNSQPGSGYSEQCLLDVLKYSHSLPNAVLQCHLYAYLVHLLIPVSGSVRDDNSNSRRDTYRSLRHSHAQSPHVHISNISAETCCYLARTARRRYQQQVRTH